MKKQYIITVLCIGSAFNSSGMYHPQETYVLTELLEQGYRQSLLEEWRKLQENTNLVKHLNSDEVENLIKSSAGRDGFARAEKILEELRQQTM
ncbi:MAG: hypothetical protein WCE21_02505 [Candidatus Babeliales bacterium]